MTWNYRIIYRDDLLTPFYGIHEVFYDDDNVIETYTEDPVDVTGETPEEVMTTLAQMLLDCSLMPVLKASELEGNIMVWEAKLDDDLDGETFDTIEDLIKFLDEEDGVT